MQVGEFIEATSRLENYYGKEYTKEQRQIMFQELKNLTIERYKRVIVKIIREDKYLPKVADILEKNREIGYEKEEEEIVDCKICKGVGLLTYKKEFEGLIYTYACRCSCQNGLRKSNKIPFATEIGV